MAAPTTLYVKDSAATEWRILSGITDWARCIIPVTGPTYRNTGWNPGTAAISNVSQVEVSSAPVGALTNATVGTFTTHYDAAVAAIVHATLPDEMTNTPPHQWLRMESATVFAFNGEDIPNAGQTIATSGWTNGAGEAIATTAAHGLSSGDFISFFAGTPGGMTTGTVYMVQVITTTTFRPLTVAGAQITLSGSTSAGNMTLVSPAALQNEQFIFVLDSNNPVFSVGDPR